MNKVMEALRAGLYQKKSPRRQTPGNVSHLNNPLPYRRTHK